MSLFYVFKCFYSSIIHVYIFCSKIYVFTARRYANAAYAGVVKIFRESFAF